MTAELRWQFKRPRHPKPKVRWCPHDTFSCRTRGTLVDVRCLDCGSHVLADSRTTITQRRMLLPDRELHP